MEFILYIIKNILSPLFYKIVTISLSASLIGIMLLIINKIFKNKLSTKINKYIWIIFLISLLFMPKIENKFSIYNFINTEKLEELSVNITFNSLDTYSDLNQKENYELIKFKNNVKNQVDKLETKEIIAIFYFVLLIIKILRNIIKKINFYKSEKLFLTKNSEEYKLIEKIKLKLNINKDVILIKCSNIPSPMISGIFTPKIYIGNNKIDLKDLECLLTHELCHFKRKDTIIKKFINIFETIYLFNPVVKICLYRIERNIELLTDEMSLKILEQDDSTRYCKLLVLMSNNKNKNYFNLGFSIKDSFIKERINNIIVRKTFKPKIKYIIVLVLIICFILFFCFTKQKIYIEDNDLKYLTINIDGNEYEIDNLEICKNYKSIKCNKDSVIKIYGNENLISLCLNTTDLKNNIQNNSTFFFDNNDIKINIGKEYGEFLYELKIQYETKQEIKYSFILEIE